MPATEHRVTASPGPPPPCDPELAAALAELAPQLPPPLTADLIGARRERDLAGRRTDEELRRGGAFRLQERLVPGPAGAPELSLLICRPARADRPLGAVYHIHGGGMVVGDNRARMPEMLDWAEEFGLVVVSVAYRLAPETVHPGPVEDCYAGLLWTAGHAEELGVDPRRIIVAGASAGGGLAAGTALLARDRGGPAIAGQVLIYPMLDDRDDTVSTVQLAGSEVWGRHANATGWGALLGAAKGGPDVSPYAAPARATDLSGLPPAFIDVGSTDLFRDEDVAYAARIWQAGGSAELHVWPGACHAFESLAPQATISRDALAARRHWLRRLFAA